MRNIMRNIKFECEKCRERFLELYGYFEQSKESVTTYFIRHSVDWVQQYFLEDDHQKEVKIKILSEVMQGQKIVVNAYSKAPDQIVFSNNEQQEIKSNYDDIQIFERKFRQQQNENQNQNIRDQQKILNQQQNMISSPIKWQQEIKTDKKEKTQQQYRTDQIKNIPYESLKLFYKSSLTRNIIYFNGFTEFLDCLADFTIYKHYFNHGSIPSYQDVSTLYLPYQALQLIKDFVLMGNPYIKNMDTENPQSYYEVKNDTLNVNNVYKFEGDYLIKIKYIGNLRDYCNLDTLYIDIAMQQIIQHHKIYKPQQYYILEILRVKKEVEILDLLLLPIVVIQLYKMTLDNQQIQQQYLFFGLKNFIYYLGNSQNNHIYIQSDSISNYQCSFEFLNGAWQIFDGYKDKYNERKPSLFGTWKLLYDEVEIKNNEQFKIKDNIFRLQIS